MTSPLQSLHVRVNDAATGQATPVRIRFTDADGNYYAPHGRLTEFATGVNQDVGGNLRLGRQAFAYIDGACEIHLLPGPLQVAISKGPEYRSVNSEIDLKPGRLALRFNIERWIDPRTQRWYAGDGRCHFLAPHAALLEGQAEDLAIVNLLAEVTVLPSSGRKKHQTIPNILAFSGQHPALRAPGCLVVVNTHNRHAALGSLGLLNSHRVVYPLTFGGPEETDAWAMADWCQQCHRKDGLVTWTRTDHETADFVFGEPLADLILGHVNAFEITYLENSPWDVLATWYLLLDAELPVPLVGSSGKNSNSQALGMMRTYARLHEGEELTYSHWIEAVRHGRTFVTNGPLVFFTVNGHDPGSNLELASPGEKVRLHAEAQCLTPFERLEILHNGQVVADATPSGSPARAVVDQEIALSQSGWLAARCQGPGAVPDRPAYQRLFAHTSPVYVRVREYPSWCQNEAAAKLAGQLDLMLRWVTDKMPCRTDAQRERVGNVLQEARQKLAYRLKD